MIFSVSSAGAANAGAWRFTTAAAKPATVVNRTILAVCPVTPTKITVADDEPASPAANNVWFHVCSSGDGVLLSDGNSFIKCVGAYRYVNDAWVLLPAYYSCCGMWVEIQGLPRVGTSLNDCTWDQIGRIVALGKAEEYFSVVDAKNVTLSTNETIMLRILDFSHDTLADGSGKRAAITFGTATNLNTEYPMNSTDTNVGGYSSSAMRTTTLNTIYNALPSDLRSVIKQVYKYTSAGNKSASIVTTAEKIFLLSEIEIHGARGESYAGEGTQYAFFVNAPRKIRTTSGVNAYWWTRSPNNTTATQFCATTSTGTYTTGIASAPHGVSFSFCI